MSKKKRDTCPVTDEMVALATFIFLHSYFGNDRSADDAMRAALEAVAGAGRKQGART